MQSIDASLFISALDINSIHISAVRTSVTEIQYGQTDTRLRRPIRKSLQATKPAYPLFRAIVSRRDRMSLDLFTPGLVVSKR
jgi:hypothetical protein